MKIRDMLIGKEEFKRSLMGALEIACFLSQAKDRFSNNVEETLRSYWMVLLSFPLNCSALFLMHTRLEEYAAIPLEHLIYNDALRIIIFGVFQALALYLLCKIWKRLEDFPRTLSGLNWMQAIAIAALAPLHLSVWGGFHEISDMGNFELIFVAYFLSAAAYFLSKSLNIPVIACAHLMILLFLLDYLSLTMMLN